MTTRSSLSYAIVLLFIEGFILCGFLAMFDYAPEADAGIRQNSYSPHLNGKPNSLPVTYTRKSFESPLILPLYFSTYNSFTCPFVVETRLHTFLLFFLFSFRHCLKSKVWSHCLKGLKSRGIMGLWSWGLKDVLLKPISVLDLHF